MSKTISYKTTYLVLGLAFMLVLFTGLGIYENSQNQKNLTEALEESFRVMTAADQLHDVLLNAETGQRGYLLTGSEEFLEPFNRSVSRLDEVYDELEDALQSNKEQLLWTREVLKPKIDLRMNLLHQIVDLYKDGDHEQAINILNTHAGNNAMNDVRVFIRQIIESEEVALQGKAADMQTFLTQEGVLLLTGSAFVLIVLGIAAITIRINSKNNERLHSELDETNITLLETKEREALKNKFMGIVSHDLRNPLSIIQSAGELISQDKEELLPEHREYLGYMKQATDQMNYLIKELLDAQKIDDGKLDVYIEEIRIYKIIEGLILGHRDHAFKKNISVRFDDHSEGHRFKTDKSIFLQVADNLISNAIKYSPENTTVTITLDKDNGEMVFSVADQGPGIREEERDLLFQRYGKLSNRPTGGEKSTGLGLWIVNERIKLLGGSIVCESEEGKGAEFIARFPHKSEAELID